MTPQTQIELVSRQAFAGQFACEVRTLPNNVVLAGWSAADGRWRISPAQAAGSSVFRDRVPPTLHFLSVQVLPRLPAQKFWFPLCFWDGWRERHAFSEDYRWVAAGNLDGVDEWRGGPGELPLLSTDRRAVFCYGAHRGDPSAFLLPEAHYLAHGHYAQLFGTVRAADLAWNDRRPRAVYCAGDHGETANYFPPAVSGRPHPRRYLRDLVASSGLEVDVRLGQAVPIAEQMTCKWILDVDGYARTWDAWAWKLYSGSVVLSVTSPWETFFTRLFTAWEHFVPVANDFSDLAARLDWCRRHDNQCRQIALRARSRAETVYRADFVAGSLAGQMRTLLEHGGRDLRIARPTDAGNGPPALTTRPT
jgi:hypothetical protein